MKYRLLLVLFLQSLLICMPAFSNDASQHDSSADDLGDNRGDNLSERLKGFALIAESSGRFKDTWMADYLNEPLVSEGRLVYTRPAQLSKFINSPEQIEQYIKGDQLSVVQNAKTRHIQLSDQPVLGAGIFALQAVLDGNEKKLHRFFTSQYIELAAGWTLTLTPRDTQVAKHIEQIVMQGKNSTIGQIRVQFVNGNTLSTEISDED